MSGGDWVLIRTVRALKAGSGRRPATAWRDKSGRCSIGCRGTQKDSFLRNLFLVRSPSACSLARPQPSRDRATSVAAQPPSRINAREKRASASTFTTFADLVTTAHIHAGVDETFPRLQILTLADLFQGKRPRIPNVDRAAFRRAAREATGTQPGLL